MERHLVRWRGAPPITLTFRRAGGHLLLPHVGHVDGGMADHQGKVHRYKVVEQPQENEPERAAMEEVRPSITDVGEDDD